MVYPQNLTLHIQRFVFLQTLCLRIKNTYFINLLYLYQKIITIYFSVYPLGYFHISIQPTHFLPCFNQVQVFEAMMCICFSNTHSLPTLLQPERRVYSRTSCSAIKRFYCWFDPLWLINLTVSIKQSLVFYSAVTSQYHVRIIVCNVKLYKSTDLLLFFFVIFFLVNYQFLYGNTYFMIHFCSASDIDGS